MNVIACVCDVGPGGLIEYDDDKNCKKCNGGVFNRTNWINMKASRDNSSKPPLDYILTFPDALRAFAMVCKHGEKRYARLNYLKSNKPLLAEYTACALRHLLAWAEGKDLDEDSGQPHLAHALWNLLALTQFSLDKTGIDDRPKRGVVDQATLTRAKEILESDWPGKLGPSMVFAIQPTKQPDTYEAEFPKPLPDTNYSVTDQILDNLAQGREDVRESVEKIVPRFSDDGYVWWKVEEDPLARLVQVKLYDLGTYEMKETEFASRESSAIWKTRDKAKTAIEGLVNNRWARRVD